MKNTTYKPFKSDGCSGWQSLMWKKLFKKLPPWESCCIIHDVSYYLGGSKKQRLEADIKLLKCVIENRHPYWAIIMFLSVRIGGTPYLPTSWRWGYGVPYGKFYQ